MLEHLRYIHFGATKAHYKVMIMIKEDGLDKAAMLRHYIEPLIVANPSLTLDDFIAVNLKFTGKKPKVKDDVRPWLNYIASLASADYLYVADSTYFKELTGVKKTAHCYGSILPSTYAAYPDSKVLLTVNHRAIFYDSKNQEKIDLTTAAFKAELGGTSLFQNVMKVAHYPKSGEDIKDFLKSLLDKPVLTADIEGFSLKHYEAKIGTIAFAWSQNEGGAFAVDYRPLSPFVSQRAQGSKGYYSRNEYIRTLLSQFFYEYLVVRKHKIIWHNISYDAKVLIWELLMQADHRDKQGMLEGLECFVNNNRFEDTKIIAYLATNSCDGNDLSLKSLALPFAGNYALDSDEITDITKVGLDDLLKYNLLDSMCTWYVYDTYYPKMVADNQLKVYEEVMKPSVKVLMQAELHGMPLNMKKVRYAKKVLQDICDQAITALNKNKYVRDYLLLKRASLYFEKHKKWVKKVLPIEAPDFDVEFNPNSSQQMAELLHTTLELPVLDLTDTKEPSVGAKTLKKLKNHTTNKDILDILDNVIKFSKAVKVLTSFIPAFEDAYFCFETGKYYLMGNFNIGGTVSGRLSSSNPNLQNIPSGSEFAKLVKDCFEAPEGYLMVGLDFNSLEDYISALTTKDPNKLKVYTDGYDGHSLRAFTYWPEKFPFSEITPELSFQVKKDPVLDAVRSASKAPTFALTYQGTWMTLMKNCGFSEEMAKNIENNFKELYKASIEYVNNKLEEASETGFVEVAFGLRLRTHAIKKAIWGSSYTPKEALAEGRTAGNALGQSYGLLNNRAGIDFQRRVLNSKFATEVFPIAHIHDAQYFIVKRDTELLAWMNKELVECVQWQELPEIQHDTVKLGGELSVFYPSWANEIVIPNGIHDREELKQHLNAAYREYKEEKAKKQAEA